MRANKSHSDRQNQRNQDELETNSAGSPATFRECRTRRSRFESVEELVEEGNAFEAAAVDGVENAKDPDVSEVTTRQVSEDDVPEEYRHGDEDVA